MTTRFTADLHFGHKNIARFCDRPWADVAEMNENLIARFNSVVAPGDTTYIVGDLSFTSITETISLLDRLNGRLLLVPGNHDPWWPTSQKANNARGRVEREAILAITPPVVRIALIPVEVWPLQDVLIAHLPYDHDERHPDDPIVDAFRPDGSDGNWLIHGHVHNLWKQRGRQINVGVDAWDGYPVDLSTVQAMIEAGPADLEAEPWKETH